MQGQLLSPPSLRNIEQLLASEGECYYVPAYQRHFAWKTEEVERFYESIVLGIYSWSGVAGSSMSALSETFMGALVCFDDCPSFEAIYPKSPNDFPARVHILVDGQQRLTMCLATAIAIHKHLQSISLMDIADLVKNNRSADLKKASDIGRHINDLKTDIEETLLDMLSSKARVGNRRYYPRMIRQHEDKWSTVREESRYKSPISYVLSHYLDFCDNKKSVSTFLSDRKLLNDSQKELVKIFDEIVNTIASIATNESDVEKSDIVFDSIPDIKTLLESKTIQRVIFNGECEPNLFTYLQLLHKKTKSKQMQNAIEEVESKYKQVLRLLVFSSYFLRRVKFAQIITTGEDYAFNIFDSLNTTGVPLTAYETYVSAVVMNYQTHHTAAGYENSSLQKKIHELDDMLAYKRNKDTKTKELLVSFALTEDGIKISKGLNDQRRYMLQKCKTHLKNNTVERDDCESINNLLYVARVSQAYDSDKQIGASKIEKCLKFLDENDVPFDSNFKRNNQHRKLAGEASFCLHFLGKTKHRMAIPVIARFYEAFVNAQNKKSAHHRNLCEVIRSTAAFFVLWRAARTGTKNIDGHHRKILFNKEKGKPELNFARGKPHVLDIKSLQDEYSRLVAEDSKIAIKETWIDCANEMPLFEEQKQIVRFILLLSAYFNSFEADTNHGFDVDVWKNEAHESIEHILPQNRIKNTGSDDLATRDLVHCIGNLTLLPQNVNSYIGGEIDWEHRKLIYAALSEKTPSDCEHKAKELKLSEEQEELLLKHYNKLNNLYDGGYIPTINRIAQFDSFGVDEIKVRGKEILDTVWGPLNKWLGKR